MVRLLGIEFPGAIYHVAARDLFLDALGEVVTRFGWLCHAYCLMDNHYHRLIETLNGNLSLGMRQLNGVYTQRFNCRHARVGHADDACRETK